MNFKTLKIPFGIALVCAVIPLWSGRYLPLTDIPQHIAQLSILQNYRNPTFNYAEIFAVHGFTPYLLPTLLGSLFGLFLPPLLAMKAVLTVILFCFPFSLRYFFLKFDGDPGWAFIGFPIFFGANFFWGHVSFLFSVPVVLWTLGFSLSFLKKPSMQNGGILCLLLHVVFFSHFLSYCLLLALLVLWFSLSKNQYPGRYKAWPVGVAVLTLLIWHFFLRNEASPTASNQWNLGWDRIVEMPQLLMGVKNDAVSFFCLSLLFIALILFPKKFHQEKIYFIPAILVFLICLFGPYSLGGKINFFAQRMTIFLIPFFLAMFKKEDLPAWRLKTGTWIITFAMVAWSTILTQRIHAFNEEARDFDEAISSMQDNKKVAGYISDYGSVIPAYFPYIHFASYYQVFKHGIVEFSFANYFQYVVIYRPHQGLNLSESQYSCEEMIQKKNFDYCLVRSPVDMSRIVVNSAEYLTHQGKWWIFKAKK